MQQANIRIIKDFREYFIKLGKYAETCQNELGIIHDIYRKFHEYAIRNNCDNGKLNQTNIRKILQKILENLRRQDIDIDDPVRNEILQLHSDLFL